MFENKFELPSAAPEQEKELNPKERERLKSGMNEYVLGLKARIEEIRAEIEAAQTEEDKETRRIELAELEEQASGLDEFAGDIDEAESIKTKSYEGEKK